MPWSGPRSRPSRTSASHFRASDKTASRSMVNQAWTRDSTLSIRDRSALAYSSAETLCSRIAAAASTTVRFSRFIIELDFCRCQFFQIGSDLLDVRTQLLRPQPPELFFGAGEEKLRVFG